MRKIGVIGCGTIGTEICHAIDRGVVTAELVGICDTEAEPAEALAAALKKDTPVLGQSALIDAVDLVVEATYRHAAPEIIRNSLTRGKDILVMSVGGLLMHVDEFRTLAEENRRQIFVPSGALAGLDAVKGAAEAEISRVTLTTRKPPRGLKGAPYVVEQAIDLDAITEATLIFSGSATEAVPAFPANINVAAALSLAGIGPEKTRVRIFADPDCDRNCHEVEVEGAFGRLVTRTELLTAPENPKTSLLAFLSAIALLRRITATVVVGT